MISKVEDIIKKKNVDINLLKETKSVQEYNNSIQDSNSCGLGLECMGIAFEDWSLYSAAQVIKNIDENNFLTEEEYNLLKEGTKDE